MCVGRCYNQPVGDQQYAKETKLVKTEFLNQLAQGKTETEALKASFQTLNNGGKPRLGGILAQDTVCMSERAMAENIKSLNPKEIKEWVDVLAVLTPMVMKLGDWVVDLFIKIMDLVDKKDTKPEQTNPSIEMVV